MPSSVGRASMHAHPGGSPARHALVVYGSSWLLPISTERQRSMPVSRFSRQVAAALSIQSSRHAQSPMLRGRSCLPNRGTGFLCPGRSSSAIGHAHLAGALAREAQSCAACHLVPSRRPNQPIQPTPLRGRKIGTILTVRICYNGVAIDRCGAADGQLVGPRGAFASLAACLYSNRHAVCSVSAATPTRMLTHTDRRRAMPRSPATRTRSCPS
jgi:hypothetical protein